MDRVSGSGKQESGQGTRVVLYVSVAVTSFCLAGVPRISRAQVRAATTIAESQRIALPGPAKDAAMCTPPSHQSGGTAQQAQDSSRGKGDMSLALHDTNDQAPAQPATVTYQKGLLAIRAQNSSLLEVLHAVAEQTGARLVLPDNCSDDRVFLNVGPATVREVVAKLLDGSRFNYIMTGAGDATGALTQLTLTPAAAPPSPDTGNSVAESKAPVRAVKPDTPLVGGTVNTPEDLQPYQPTEQLQAPKQPIPGEVLEQMLRERIEARQAQQKAEQENNPQ
jgi:hypothetical protein